MFGKKSAIGCGFFIVAAIAAAQVPQQGRPVPTPTARPELSVVVGRMEQAARENRERYRAYVITREYRMYGSQNRTPSSTVFADISFIPPSKKNFTITRTEGSTRGENVVRHILENEQKAAETGRAPGAVNRDNYSFTLQGEQALEGHDCFVLGLVPKRKEKSLVLGRAWVDKDTYLVRRVEGQMAKMPSWWIKSVQVRLGFGEVSGMWLQTSLRAEADVRIFGPHTLQENAVKVRTGSTVSEVTTGRPKGPPRRAFGRPEAVLGSFDR